MEQTFLQRIESSPILTEGDRKIIATRFINRLCDLDSYAIRQGPGREFTVGEIWDNYLSGFNKEVVAPFVIFYFENELGYIQQHANGNVSLTLEGRKHCKGQFVLPAGL